MEIRGNMKPPKGHNHSPLTDLKEKEINEMSEKEFEIMISRKLNKIQNNTDSCRRKIK